MKNIILLFIFILTGGFLLGDNVFATACEVSADCPSGQACYSGICSSINVLTDSNNCGLIGRICPSGTTCSVGVCSYVVKTINIIYPNGGESLGVGNSYDIKWSSSGVSNVNIDLQLGSGIQWWRLASNVPATNGKLTWTIQSSSAIGNISTGNNYKILIWDASSSILQSSTTQDLSDNYFNIVSSGGDAGTTGSTAGATASGCDASSFLSSSSPYVFSSTSPKTNMCGKEQFYNIAIPSNQSCDLKWSLQSNSGGDYDLYTKWADSGSSRNSYSERSTLGVGILDELSKTKAPNGTYYVSVYSENTPVGNYSLTALLSNCSGATTNTNTTSTTTNTTTSQDQTIANLQNQINQLLSQLSQVRTQLQNMQSGQTNTNNNTNTNTNTNANNGWCYTFRNNLKYLDSGSDVLALQTALQKEGLYYGKLGGNFGRLTQSAVIKLQQKYLVSSGLALGTGFVGPQTLNKLNDIYDCQ